MKAENIKKPVRKSSRVKRSRRIPIRTAIVLMLIVGTALILIQTDFKLKLSDIFVKTEYTASSTAILKQIKEISRLDSIEFIYKTVFPWDLLDSDIDLKTTLKNYKAGNKINYKEAETLAIYGIAREADIDLLSDSYEFAVISTRVKAGWEFQENSDDIIMIDTETNTIRIQMPDAKVTEIIIEDADSSTYDYPDLEVSPDQWKTLTSIISRKVKAEAEQRKIIEMAEERGREFISRMLKSSGFNEVIFVD